MHRDRLGRLQASILFGLRFERHGRLDSGQDDMAWTGSDLFRSRHCGSNDVMFGEQNPAGPIQSVRVAIRVRLYPARKSCQERDSTRAVSFSKMTKDR